jgi:hypothetical protein
VTPDVIRSGSNQKAIPVRETEHGAILCGRYPKL